jgi:hypothetical protein
MAEKLLLRILDSLFPTESTSSLLDSCTSAIPGGRTRMVNKMNRHEKQLAFICVHSRFTKYFAVSRSVFRDNRIFKFSITKVFGG